MLTCCGRYPPELGTDAERTLSSTMGCYWSNFAHTGNPNSVSAAATRFEFHWPKPLCWFDASGGELNSGCAVLQGPCNATLLAPVSWPQYKPVGSASTVAGNTLIIDAGNSSGLPPSQPIHIVQNHRADKCELFEPLLPPAAAANIRADNKRVGGSRRGDGERQRRPVA